MFLVFRLVASSHRHAAAINNGVPAQDLNRAAAAQQVDDDNH
jgi:hypothetical protein